jgi:hypothetical protein
VFGHLLEEVLAGSGKSRLNKVAHFGSGGVFSADLYYSVLVVFLGKLGHMLGFGF